MSSGLCRGAGVVFRGKKSRGASWGRGQSATASYVGLNTKFSVHGLVIKDKVERRKEIAQICMMHPNTFVAQTS